MDITTLSVECVEEWCSPAHQLSPVSYRSSLALLFLQRTNWAHTPLLGVSPILRISLTASSPTKIPGGGITNSDLDLAGGIFQHFCAADSYDVRDHTVLSRTENSADMWWMRKGSATCTSPPAHHLRLQAVHQRHHRYFPRHDFVSGVDNNISDVPYLLSALSDNQLLAFSKS